MLHISLGKEPGGTQTCHGFTRLRGHCAELQRPVVGVKTSLMNAMGASTLSDRDAAADETEFRAEVRRFLDEKLPPERRFSSHTLDRQKQETTRWWHATLAAHGWGAPSWPVELGGTGWSSEQRRIFEEECALAGAPLGSAFGIVMVGPVIYTFGTEEQKAQHLPPILDGSILWCQGYSEPAAGSDLASLDCRAVLDGDHYVINGQKIWTTQAHWADWMFCLVRTKTDGRPQEGISFILMDMKTPGIEVRPIYTIDGLHHLNEVFFSDVRVPATNLVGEPNMGWTYAKFLLVNERHGIAAVAHSQIELERLRSYASSEEHFASPPIRDPYFQERIADLENRLKSLEALEARALAADEKSIEGAKLSAPLKLLGSHIMQDIAELYVELAGPAALPAIGAESAFGSLGTEFMTNHLLGRAHTIYGGTSEVQKNVLAKLMASR